MRLDARVHARCLVIFLRLADEIAPGQKRGSWEHGASASPGPRETHFHPLASRPFHTPLDYPTRRRIPARLPLLGHSYAFLLFHLVWPTTSTIPRDESRPL